MKPDFRGIRSLLMAAALTLSAGAARAQASIDLSNLPPNMRNDLLRAHPEVTSTASLALIDQVLRTLQAATGVEQVSAFENNGVISFEIRWSRKVGSISFTGLAGLSQGQALSALGFSEGSSYESVSLMDGIEQLRKVYRSQGWLNPRIEVQPVIVGPGIVDLQFEVREGVRTILGEYIVRSSDNELNLRLQKLLRDRHRGPFSDERLQNAQAVLRDELKKSKHLRADVLAPEIRFNADESTASVSYRIERVSSYSVEFRGQRDLSARTLETKVLDLENFTTTNPNIAAEMTEKIRQAYLQRGFARVEVTAEEIDGRRPFTRRLIFTINEGPKVRIADYEISGRISRKPPYYADYIRDHSTPLIKQNAYNREDLETGFKNLIVELQNEGFLLAKIVSTRSQYNRDRTQITIFVNIDEGPLTLVDQVLFEGNQRVSSEELRRLLNLKSGEALRLDEIEHSIGAIKTFYQEKGFLEMQLLNDGEDLVQYNEDNTRASLSFKVFEGPQVSVGSIILDGNSFTRDNVILNELDFSVGDLLTPSKIDESIARLQRTGHFGSVEIRTLEEKTGVESRTVIVRISERDPGVFTLGAGATNERNLTVRGYTSVAYRNIMGTGRGASLRLDGNYNILGIKYPELRLTFGYLEPYLFNTRVRGRINISRSKSVVDYERSKIREVNQATWSIERSFTSNVIGTWDLYSIATVKEFTIDPNEEFRDQLLDIASTGPTLDFDYRDNPFYPTRGHLTTFNVEYSTPSLGSSRTIEYWRATAGFNFYLGVPNTRVVWANSLRGGILQNLSKEPDGAVPYDKKGFILGGRSTLRGYEAGTSEVFPNASDLGDPDYALKTRARMGLIKSEVRFPVWGSLEGAVFYDGGTVTIDGLEFKDNYRDTAGFGIRYMILMIPLNLEFGWKLDQRDGEEPWRFHLSMGTF